MENSLQAYALSEYPIPTLSDLLIEASSQYYSIIKSHVKFIQPSTSPTSILHLESQLGILQDTYESLRSPLLQADYPESMDKLNQKLQAVQAIQIKQQTMISECAAQLKKVPTQLASQEENLFLQAQQELCTQISSLCSQLIKNLEEAKKNILVVVN